MSTTEIIIASLAMAFCWVEYFNQIKFRPFNCIKCMTGWFSFALALGGHLVWYYTKDGEHTWIVYCLILGSAIRTMAIGVFVGMIWENIKMRWL